MATAPSPATSATPSEVTRRLPFIDVMPRPCPAPASTSAPLVPGAIASGEHHGANSNQREHHGEQRAPEVDALLAREPEDGGGGGEREARVPPRGGARSGAVDGQVVRQARGVRIDRDLGEPGLGR